MINPLKFLKRKKQEETEAVESENSEDTSEDSSEKLETKREAKKEEYSGGSGDLIKITTEIDRLKASVDSFGEVRKAINERISAVNEQIGELRAMIMDRDRTIQEIELKSVKAADLVESVQPDKLMIEVQRQDAKFEAIKANVEGNEAIMDRVMDELKEVRRKLSFFQGVEEIIKLAEEVKKELIEMKKTEASVQVNTDKVQTIYSELKKNFQEIDIFNDSLKEMKVMIDQNAKDNENIKTKISGLADKSELDRLVQKVQRYVDALQEINKASSLTKDVSQLKSLLESLR